VELDYIGRAHGVPLPRPHLQPDGPGASERRWTCPKEAGITQTRTLSDTRNLTVVNTKMVTAAERVQGVLQFAGDTWVRARADPQNDPKGAPQGVDLIVVSKGTTQ
jgi:hypothetical protein